MIEHFLYDLIISRILEVSCTSVSFLSSVIIKKKRWLWDKMNTLHSNFYTHTRLIMTVSHAVTTYNIPPKKELKSLGIQIHINVFMLTLHFSHLTSVLVDAHFVFLTSSNPWWVQPFKLAFYLELMIVKVQSLKNK